MNRGNKSASWNDKHNLEVLWYLYNRADTLKSKHEKDFLTQKFEIYLGSDLNYLIRYYQWVIRRNHGVYSKYKNTLNNISLSNLVMQLETYQECHGITLPDNQQVYKTYSYKT